MPQIKAPISVSGSDAAWSKNGAGTTILCTSDPISSPNDSTYISNAAADPIRVKVDPADHPNQVDGLKIKIRAQGSDALQTFTLRLYQGATLIAEYIDLPAEAGSFKTTEQELTEEEAASITDYSDLYLEAQSQTSDQLDVSVLELEAADRILRVYVTT